MTRRGSRSGCGRPEETKPLHFVHVRREYVSVAPRGFEREVALFRASSARGDVTDVRPTVRCRGSPSEPRGTCSLGTRLLAGAPRARISRWRTRGDRGRRGARAARGCALRRWERTWALARAPRRG